MNFELTAEQLEIARQTYDLTAGELEIIRAVYRGLSNREISQEVRTAEHLIMRAICRIFDKTNAHTRVELVVLLHNLGKQPPQ